MEKFLIKFLTLTFLFLSTNLFANEKLIPQKELSEKIQKFVSENFADLTVDYVTVDKELLTTEYEIKFTNGLEVEFNKNGDWTEVDGKKQVIPIKFIQKNILEYLDKNFPEPKIIKIEKKRFGRQEVKLSNGLELIFDSEGNFKKID